MVTTKFKDGVVYLSLNNEIKLEQAEINGYDFEYGLTIGSYVNENWVSDPDTGEWSVTVTRSDADYDTAFVGKDAALLNANVSDDGSVFVDVGGKIGGINITGGLYSGSGICENAKGWYGAGICLTASNGKGEIHLSGATFSGCEVAPLNGYTGHGGAIETYGGILSVQDSLFAGNKAKETSAAGGAMALMFSTNTVSGSTFSDNSAYFGGAIQQNSGTLTVTGSVFTGNKTEGEPTDKLAPGGGAIEIHNGGTASISGSTFSKNVSRSGGAIYNDTYEGLASDTTVSGSTFSGNSADYQGGAIYNYAVLSVSDSEFTGNKVNDPDPYSYTSFGGAIANTNSGSLTVTGDVFAENSAVQGGAIATFIQPWGSDNTADLTVTGATFTDNAATYGGGIYIQTGTADATVITGTDFTGNTASYGGGAICRCYGVMTVNGGTFTSNTSGNDGGAIAVWDSWDKKTSISGATFVSNIALYGGAISHSYAASPLLIYGCTFNGNSAALPEGSGEAGEAITPQGGAIWNPATSTGTVTVNGCKFDGNTAAEGGAIWNGGSMNLENVTFSTSTDTVYNSGMLTFYGANTIGAGIVNNGKVTFSISAGTDALISDLGQFGGTGSYLLKLASGDVAEGALFASSAGNFSGSLSVSFDGTAASDAFTLNGGVIGNDLALISGGKALRLVESKGVLTVRQETMEKLVPVVSNDGSIVGWADGEYAGGYWVEIAAGDSFENAIRVATAGTAFDVVGRAGSFSCRAAEKDSSFTAAAAAWTASESAPRQVASNGNGRADVFFASVDANDIWSSAYQAKNTVTGETSVIAGKNRIRDTFSGSASDANILYLSDTANGDALFMDDIYSQFGEAARVSLIREVRSGAGDDIVDMTSNRYTAELAGMTVRGGSGNDVLWGASGGNSLFGDAGDDLISGGTGDDLIAGGSGDDVLQGGGGKDIFTFGENWGADIVSQAAGGTVELWFFEAESQISNVEKDGGVVFSNAAGTSTVTVKGVAFADLTVHYGDDGTARFDELAAAGAFLGNTSESVFETESTRTNGILASL